MTVSYYFKDTYNVHPLITLPSCKRWLAELPEPVRCVGCVTFIAKPNHTPRWHLHDLIHSQIQTQI